ncbi:discoidin domain-containing protein [Streptomyces xiamenensis]
MLPPPTPAGRAGEPRRPGPSWARADDGEAAKAAPRRPGEREERPADRGADAPEPEAPAEAPPEQVAAPPRNCPSCSARNEGGRRLCERCGALLTEAPPEAVAAPLPWWRRIFRRGPRAPMDAGTRPAGRRRRRPRLLIPVLIVLLALLAWFGRDQIAELFDSARDRTGEPEALHPAAVRASSEDPAHPATDAFDGFSNRHWSPAATGSGEGEYLEVDFGDPVRLTHVLITPGASAHQDEFLAQGRPESITVTLTDTDGTTHEQTISLRDEPGGQSFEVTGSDVVALRLTTESAHGARDDTRLAIAEVELFGRR